MGCVVALDDTAVEIGMCVTRREISGTEDVKDPKKKGVCRISAKANRIHRCAQSGIREILSHILDCDHELIKANWKLCAAGECEENGDNYKGGHEKLKLDRKLSNGRSDRLTHGRVSGIPCLSALEKNIAR
jgi:hypothetical protein